MSPAKAKNPRHSAESHEWYTPTSLIDAERQVMGGIDLDPASCAEANVYVEADYYYTRRQNGLEWSNPWFGKMHINPPGGSRKKDIPSLVAPFWQRLVMEYERRVTPAGRLETTMGLVEAGLIKKRAGKTLLSQQHRPVEQAMWVGFSLDQLQVLQNAGCGKTPLDYPICYLKRRLRFLRPKSAGPKIDRPSHGNYVCYLPPREPAVHDHERLVVDQGAVGRFVKVFEQIGHVVLP